MYTAGMIALLLLSVTVSPWAGLWRIDSGQHQAPHLYIHQDGTVQMFALDWSAFAIRESRVTEDEIVVQFTEETSIELSRLTLKPDGNGLKGSMAIAAGGGQFAIEQPVRAIRVAEKMPVSPQQWIADARKENRIDVVALVLEAPRESFEDFLKFWDEKVIPAYYPFLNHALYGKENDSQLRLQQLRRLFEHLSDFEEEASLRVARAREAVSEAAQSHRGLRAQMKEDTCIVLLPAFDKPRVDMHTVATARLKREPGQILCCGSREYKIENFVFVELAPPAKPSPEGQEEQSPTADHR